MQTPEPNQNSPEVAGQGIFNPEQLAAEWANRVCTRLRDIKIPEDEVNEMYNIIYAFTKTAMSELMREKYVALPYTTEKFEIQPRQAHEIIELFLRGINQCAKKLRETGKSWDERKVLLETLAWKLFNLAKLLVGFMNVPNPAFQNLLKTPKDLQLMMKQSADSLLQEELTGQKAGEFPFNYRRL